MKNIASRWPHPWTLSVLGTQLILGCEFIVKNPFMFIVSKISSMVFVSPLTGEIPYIHGRCSIFPWIKLINTPQISLSPLGETPHSYLTLSRSFFNFKFRPKDGYSSSTLKVAAPDRPHLPLGNSSQSLVLSMYENFRLAQNIGRTLS